MRWQVTEGCSYPPGKCFATGTNKGPMVVLGQIKGYGYVYLSEPVVAEVARHFGYVHTDEVAERLAEVDRRSATVEEMADKAAGFDAVVDLMADLLPTKIVEKQVAIYKDHKIGQENVALKDQVRNLKEQVATLSSRLSTNTQRRQVAEHVTPAVQGVEPPAKVQLHAQTVDLDELLTNRVQDIITYAQDTPVEFRAALAAREIWLRRSGDQEPRRMVTRLAGE